MTAALAWHLIYTLPGLPFGTEAGCITGFAKHGNVSQPVSVAVTK